MKDNNRASLDEALANMFSSDNYKNSTLFYAHMLSQVKIIVDNNLPAPAGVAFTIDHYTLYVNDKMFSEFLLEDRMFILIHEMLHILMGHLNVRKELGTADQTNPSVKHKIQMLLQDKDDKYIEDLKAIEFENVKEMHNYILDNS